MFVFPSLTRKLAFDDSPDQTLKPFITDRPGLDWEHHIAETPRDLWRVGGLDAPPSFSEAEKIWVETNKPTPWRL